jgi:hypothetical protein
MVYGTYNELVNGVYKPSFNWGAHIVHIYYYIIYNWNCASEHDVLEKNVGLVLSEIFK